MRLSFLIALLVQALYTGSLAAQTAAPDQYLIPVIPISVPGAFGSVWTNELTIHNGADANLVVAGPLCNPNVLSCSNLPIVLTKGGTYSPILYVQRPFTDGAFIYVQPPADGLAMQFRIRDLSRSADTWGTELPVVPITRFRSVIRLLDVPILPRFRNMLRVYSAANAIARVRIFPLVGFDVLFDQSVTLSVPTTGVDLNFSPGYAQLALPTGLGADRVRVEVMEVGPTDTPIWGFVSVTNNETQDVTAITPQP